MTQQELRTIWNSSKEERKKLLLLSRLQLRDRLKSLGLSYDSWHTKKFYVMRILFLVQEQREIEEASRRVFSGTAKEILKREIRERNQSLFLSHLSGKTFHQLGFQFGVSKQRAHQIVRTMAQHFIGAGA